jgi:tetratricopeptide (TPR) repeat protein
MVRYVTAFFLGGLVAAGLAFLVGAWSPFREPALPPVPSLHGLLALDPQELEGSDIATMNLLCAVGLPGAENLDIAKSLTTLDEWAERVRHETERYLYKFRQAPQDYNHSEGYFRMLTLITVLQQDLGVRYNKERIRDIDFTNSKDLFIHGMIGSDNGGTCVSMPVIYVAVARRLGCPVWLVLAKAHVFARWESEDGKERFNIEGTNQGMNCFEDDYYKTWPMKMTEAEARSGRYLKSLRPAEELAVFLAARGHCLADTGRMPEAMVAYAHAHRFAPTSPDYIGFLAEAVSEEFPYWVAPRAAEQRGPALQDPLEELRQIEAINAYNRALMGLPPQRTPVPAYPRPPAHSPQPSSPYRPPP